LLNVLRLLKGIKYLIDRRADIHHNIAAILNLLRLAVAAPLLPFLFWY